MFGRNRHAKIQPFLGPASCAPGPVVSRLPAFLRLDLYVLKTNKNAGGDRCPACGASLRGAGGRRAPLFALSVPSPKRCTAHAPGHSSVGTAQAEDVFAPPSPRPSAQMAGGARSGDQPPLVLSFHDTHRARVQAAPKISNDSTAQSDDGVGYWPMFRAMGPLLFVPGPTVGCAARVLSCIGFKPLCSVLYIISTALLLLGPALCLLAAVTFCARATSRAAARAMHICWRAVQYCLESLLGCFALILTATAAMTLVPVVGVLRILELALKMHACNYKPVFLLLRISVQASAGRSKGRSSGLCSQKAQQF